MGTSPAEVYYHLLIAALSRVRRLCREEERSVGRAGCNILLTPSSRHANHLSLLTLAPPKWNSSSILVIMTNGQLRCQGSLGDKALVVRQVVADLAGSGGFVRSSYQIGVAPKWVKIGAYQGSQLPYQTHPLSGWWRGWRCGARGYRGSIYWGIAIFIRIGQMYSYLLGVAVGS